MGLCCGSGLHDVRMLLGWMECMGFDACRDFMALGIVCFAASVLERNGVGVSLMVVIDSTFYGQLYTDWIILLSWIILA